MKKPICLIFGASLIACIGAAKADDHLFEAQQHGLSSDGNAVTHTHAFDINKAGHSGDLAPGQGSPFAGEEQKTPATDTDAANEHANVKERGAK
ncbi:MAG TPA: hypothetical protein VJV39_20510 [Dongiaceae bacterium]|nr:hypothetical protein [Dongiaceae bacterium]